MTRFTWMLLGLVIGCGGDDGGTPADGNPQQGDGPAAMADSKSIGPAGGTLTVDGAVLTIPPNALAAPVTLTLTKTGRSLAGGFTQATPVYQLDPAGQTFAIPVTLALTYPTGTTPPSQNLIHWTKAGVTTPATVDDYDHILAIASGQTLTVNNTHFCEVGAAACPCEPTTGIVNIAWTVQGAVANAGNCGTANVDIRIGELLLASVPCTQKGTSITDVAPGTASILASMQPGGDLGNLGASTSTNVTAGGIANVAIDLVPQL